MDAIVSVTSDWGIGLNGELPVRNRWDMRKFRELTEGGTIICGRTTFESFPHGALSNRLNIVVTRDGSYVADGAITASCIDDAILMASNAEYGNGRIWVVGGGSIYWQMLPLCDEAYVTMHYTIPESDTFFPNLDEDPHWMVIERQGPMETEDGVAFEFRRYRKAPIGTPL